MNYEKVIGLEIHIQANTKSKMFCSCSADYFQKEPNVNICPVCFGLPGALPVPNKLAIEKCIKLSKALNCSINQNTKFDRKNYYYPDLPKGYQISQFDVPIGEDGYIEIEVGDDSRRIRIKRVHMEEDTAKSMHMDSNETYIDFNKSGVPLIEVVTEPDFQLIEEVEAFAKRLRQIVRYADVSDAEMQKGQMRYELNMSLRTSDLKEHELPNYRVEVKNIGSISALRKVIESEEQRQSKILSRGDKIINQTRGLRNMSGETNLQREKETSDDYRYFPEPDIPPIILSENWIQDIQESIPELPLERKNRYLRLGMEIEQAEIYVEDSLRGDFLDRVLDASNQKIPVSLISNWINTEVSAYVEKLKLDFRELPLKIQDLIYLLNLLQENKITGTIAKKVLEIIFKGSDEAAEEIIKENNWLQITDENEIEEVVNKVIANNQSAVENAKTNPNSIQFLVGQVMKETRGKANPKVAEQLLKDKI